jgi:hypothetical protein
MASLTPQEQTPSQQLKTLYKKRSEQGVTLKQFVRNLVLSGSQETNLVHDWFSNKRKAAKVTKTTVAPRTPEKPEPKARKR